MTMEDGIAEFGFDCKVRKLSARTIANYQKQMKYLQRYLKEEFEVTTVEDVKSYHLKQFLAMMDDRGRKPRYINDLLKVFKTFFNYCKKEGHIKQSPAANVKNMKQPKVKILTFNEEEIRKLLNYFNKRDYLSVRNRTILAMFFDTGVRLTELMTMKEEQLHDEFILIHGKGAKERVVPISPYLSKALMQYLRVKEHYFEGRLPENYLFVSKTGHKLTQEGIAKWFKKAAEDVGVKETIRVSPHTCRHTFAHLQLKNGLDLYSLSRVMGHESVAITQRYLEGIKDDEVLKKAQKSGVLANL